MRGPTCSSRLGEDWIDKGTLARTRTQAASNRSEIPRPPRTPLAFTIAYRDKEGSFEKAALTWSDENVGAVQRVHAGFQTLEGFFDAFRGLARHVQRSNGEFVRGALFVHSSAPYLDQKTGPSARFGLETRPASPKTLAELRRLEELGLDMHTAGVTVLARLPKLPWAEGAVLEVIGCNSGGTPEAPGGIAEVLSLTQKVTTVGESGKAYFSTRADRFEEVQGGEKKIYLRAFHRGKNLLLDAFEDAANLPGSILNLNQPMPRRTFWRR